MQRYAGEHLGIAPHIVVLGSCKVGNFIVSTPVLRGLRKRFPDAVIGFLGSQLTADFERAHSSIDWRHSWDDPAAAAGLLLQQNLHQKLSLHGPVALALNLDGFNPVTCTLMPWLQPKYVAGGSLKPNLRSFIPWGNELRQRFLGDPDWDSPAFIMRYSGVFQSQYIAELFCQLAYLHEYVDPVEMDLPFCEPAFTVPELLIHCTTARAAKVWPFHYWADVIRAVTERGWRVGLVGSPPKAQRETYNAGDGEQWLLQNTDLIDLRGKTTLIELAGAARQARAVVSVDAGPLHIAAAMGTPTLAVVGNDAEGVGASPIRLWLPRSVNCERTVSTHSCNRCALNHFRNDDCLVEGHLCMAGVTPDQALNWLEPLLP
ncbi:MAG: glycosyltransferase family 9 protein [Prochlorococcus sp.]